MTELAHLSAERLLAEYRRGTFTPVDVLQSISERIARLNPGWNAFAAINPGALKDAGDSAQRWRAGRPLGPLDGVPCTIEDGIDVAGLPTRHGSRTTPVTPARQDAPLVLGLRNTGAVVLGKTTVAEFGWKLSGDSPLHGITRNPWNPDHAGTGPATAAAACFGPLHVAADAGGGLRVAASWGGLVGFKPSFGRVPLWPPALLPSVAVAGSMARTVRDAALLFGTLARHDWRDPFCLPDGERDWLHGIEDGVAGLRVAVLRNPGFDAAVDADGIAAVEAAAEILHDAGAELEEVDPGLPDTGRLFASLWRGALQDRVAAMPAEKRALLEPSLLASAEADGPSASIDAHQVWAAHAMASLHRTHELVLCPAVPGPPPPATAPEGDPTELLLGAWAPWTMAFSLTRQPAIAVPMGLGAGGLPRSVQLAAAMHEDVLLLRAARTLERGQPPLPFEGDSA